MANQNNDAGQFYLIITDVEQDQEEALSNDFASAFSLDPEIAGRILKGSPMIFAEDLTKKEIRAITPKLRELSGKGLEFRVTARVPDGLAKLHWPVRPRFTAANSGSAVAVSFDWNNNAFICPGCGETFHFRRLGKLNLGATPVSAPTPPAAPQAAPELVEEVVESIEPVEDAEILEIADDVEEIGLEDVDLSSEVEMDVEEISLDDETATDGTQPEGVISPPEETSLEDLEGDEGLLEEVEEEIPAGKRYNVFLSKISDSAKRVKAAGLLSKVKGCSPGEAKELATRLVIPLAKGVSKEKAEDVLGQFKKLKVFGRMTEVK